MLQIDRATMSVVHMHGRIAAGNAIWENVEGGVQIIEKKKKQETDAPKNKSWNM